MSRLRPFSFAIFLILLLGLPSPQPGFTAQGSDIHLLSPGEGSLVTSPIQLTAEIAPGSISMVRAVLIDRSGITLARQLLRVDQNPDEDTFGFKTLIPFDIPETTVEAMLTLSVLDEYYRPIALRSVIITLQSDGDPSFQMPRPDISWLMLTEPKPLLSYSGGEIQVGGTIIPLTQEPVVIELITSEWRVVGSSQLPVNQPNQPLEFDLSLPYSRIESLTNARLVLRQAADPYESDAVLDSLVITLLP